MMYAHNVVDAVEVHDLGEDGDAWLALGCDQESVARIAVIRMLILQLGNDYETLGLSVDDLMSKSAQFRHGWYFHDDGIHDPTLRAALYSTTETQVAPGFAFGIATVAPTMRPHAQGKPVEVSA